MKRLVAVMVVLAAFAVVSPAAWAQRPGGGGRGGGFGPSMFGLLSQKSVQDELKLTADQTASVTKQAEKLRPAAGQSRNLSREERTKLYQQRTKDGDAAVAEILKPEQVQRLKQILLQQRGVRAFAEATVADDLKLTDDQKTKIKTVQEDMDKDTRGLFQPGGDRDEMRKKMTEIRKASEEKVMGILTDEQKAKWKEMTGPPFTGEIRRGFGPGAGGRPRGRGQKPDSASPPNET